jgi:hypothetical protein
VQQRDQRGGAEPREGRFELERLVDRLVDELFDDRFTPGAKSPLAEAAAESLDAGDADSLHLGRVAVEDDNARVGEDLADFYLLVGLHIMVSKHSHGWNPERRQLAREHACLVRQTIVGQIAGEQHHVSRLGNLREQRLKDPVGRPGAV